MIEGISVTTGIPPPLVILIRTPQGMTSPSRMQPLLTCSFIAGLLFVVLNLAKLKQDKHSKAYRRQLYG